MNVRIPRNRAFRRSAIARRHAEISAVVCGSCSRPTDPATADRIREQLANLGATPETLATVGAVCGRCCRRVIEAAVSIAESRSA